MNLMAGDPSIRALCTMLRLQFCNQFLSFLLLVTMVTMNSFFERRIMANRRAINGSSIGHHPSFKKSYSSLPLLPKAKKE